MSTKLRDSAVAMEALIFIAVVHEGGDDCPFFGVFIVELGQSLVLIRGPSFNFTFFGVEVLLFDFQIDFNTIKALNGFAKLS